MAWEFIKPACELISTQVDALVVYEHEPHGNEDNVHVHMYLVGTRVSTDTLKNYIKKCGMIPKRSSEALKGNAFWSFKTEYTPYGDTQTFPVDTGCISYMSEGKLEPKYVKGFTSDEIEMYRDKWDPTIVETRRKEKIQSKLMYVVKETHKESKLRQNQMVDEIVKRLKDDSSDNAILLAIRQVVIIEQNTICGRYKIRDYYDTVKARLVSKESWLSEMKGFVFMRS